MTDKTYRISFGGVEKVPKLIMVMALQLCEPIRTIELYSFVLHRSIVNLQCCVSFVFFLKNFYFPNYTDTKIALGREEQPPEMFPLSRKTRLR